MAKRKHSNVLPKEKGIYAWNSLHAGSFILFIKTHELFHQFMFLPGPSEYCLTFEDFSACIKSGVLEFVEQLPDDVFQDSLNFFLSCPSNKSKVINNENKQ